MPIKLKIAVLLFFTLLSLPSVGRSQLSDWLPCSGPTNVGGIAIAPNGDYFVSGSYVLYRSTDQGLSWTVNRAGPFESTRYDEIYNLSGPIIFTNAGMLVDGYLTTDYGAHWTHNANAAFGPGIVSDFSGTFVCGILADPNPRIVASSNGGVTWNEIVDAASTDSIQTLLGVTSNGVLFADRLGTGTVRWEHGTWSTIDSVTVSGPMFEISTNVLILFDIKNNTVERSYDNGIHWTQDSLGLVPNFNSLNSAIITRVDTATFLMTGLGGIRVSSDTCHTSQLAISDPLFPGMSSRLSFMAKGSDYSHQLYSDGYDVDGPQWNSDGFQTTLGTVSYITDFAISKYGTLYATGGSEDLYAETLVQSTDSGISWLPSTATFNGSILQGTAITIDSDDFKYISNSGTAPCMRINPDGTVDSLAINEMIQLVTHPNNTLFARTDHGSFTSIDHGDTWEPMSTPLPTIMAIAGDGTMYGFDSTVYNADSVTQQLLRSTDLGKTWSVIRPVTYYPFWYTIDPVSPASGPRMALCENGTLFLAIDSVGIFMSVDRGDNWSLCKSKNLFADAENYAGFGADAYGTLYLSTLDGNSFNSTDNGDSWNQDDYFFYPYRFVLGTPAGTYAWAPANGGLNSGIARFTGNQEELSVSSNSSAASETSSVFPNPFSSRTTIQFNFASPELATIVVVDPLGREVFRTSREYSDGIQTINFNGSTLPCGAYYYRIESGEETVSGTMTIER